DMPAPDRAAVADAAPKAREVRYYDARRRAHGDVAAVGDAAGEGRGLDMNACPKRRDRAFVGDAAAEGDNVLDQDTFLTTRNPARVQDATGEAHYAFRENPGHSRRNRSGIVDAAGKGREREDVVGAGELGTYLDADAASLDLAGIADPA